MKAVGAAALMALASGFGANAEEGRSALALTDQPIDVSGFYIGAMIGVGSSTKIESWRQTFPDWPYTYGDLRAKSPNVGITTGYNFMSGSTLFGIQFDMTGDITKQDRTIEYPTYSGGYPRKVWEWTGGPHGKPVGTVEKLPYAAAGGMMAEDLTEFYSYNEVIAPTLSFRFGHQIDQVLLYGRVGSGVARIEETWGYDDSRSIYCNTSRQEIHYVSPTKIERWNVDCEKPTSGRTARESKTITRPTATIALGAEYHFDRYFTRVEGEMRHIFLEDKLYFGSSDGLTTYKVNFGIGVRF